MKTAVVAAIGLWAMTVAVVARPAQEPGAKPSEFQTLSDEELLRLMPAGTGRETALRVCASECHSADRVAAHAGGRDYWTDVVQQMTLHGAQFTSDEQEDIVAYLADQLPEKIDINLLNERLLQTRLTFTAAEAAAIVAWRAEHGPFRSIDQLFAVPGVAADRVNAIRRRLLF